MKKMKQHNIPDFDSLRDRARLLHKLCIACSIILIVIVLIIALTGCSEIAMIESAQNALKGSIIGNAFTCEFYDNTGTKFMNVHGTKIDMSANTVQEYSYDSEGSYIYTETMTSVITITIDGSQIESCGTTVLFIEDGLTPEVDFNTESVSNINSSSDGFSDNTFVASIVNSYKNVFGKPTVVVIQSQLGDPICAFSGNDVYWEVCSYLPKTTKLMIDGKALYIHRANFQIIDKDLLN